MRYIIALYEIDRAYGGAEEGGWWYDTGELARLLALAPTEARAIQLADRANRLLERLQRHRRRVDSVLYDGGRYTAIVFEWTAPRPFPRSGRTTPERDCPPLTGHHPRLRSCGIAAHGRSPVEFRHPGANSPKPAA
ncbi:hypothetical protein ACFSTI_32505 [Rhizorhabdus histidinilytica]